MQTVTITDFGVDEEEKPEINHSVLLIITPFKEKEFRFLKPGII